MDNVGLCHLESRRGMMGSATDVKQEGTLRGLRFLAYALGQLDLMTCGMMICRNTPLGFLTV